MKWNVVCFALLLSTGLAQAAETKLDGMSIYLLGEFILTQQGEVQDLKIASSKYPEVDRDLLQAVSGWKYHPYILDGNAIDVPIEIDVRLDAIFKPDGQVEQLRVASVRYKVKNEFIKSTSSAIPKVAIRYPTQFISNVEANVMLAYEISKEGLVQHVSVQAIRLFPIGRMGLSEKRLEFAVKEFSNAALANKVGLKIDLSKMKSDFKCNPICPKIGQLVFFNLPPGNRFRSWRGYHDVEIPQLESMMSGEIVLEPQQIELIDPSQEYMVL